MQKPTIIWSLLSKGLIICLLLFNSCSQMDQMDIESFEQIDQVLNGAEFKIHKGLFTFKDRKAFDSFVKTTENWTDEVWNEWEISNNFKSLARIHEEVIEEEVAFLNEMDIKYKGDESITRKDIGYTKNTEKLLKQGVLIINEFELLDLNIPVEFYSHLLNNEGVLRIGNDIYVPKKDFIMIIHDGDFGKVAQAKTYKVGNTINDPSISIAKVFTEMNTVNSTVNARSQTWVQSCSHISGNYQILAYDQYTGVVLTGYGDPCTEAYADYSVQLRSLKKTLGIWFNNKTSQFRLECDFVAEHWGKCQVGPPDEGVNYRTYFIRTVRNYSRQIFTGPYDHTWVRPLITNYQLGPCESGGLDSCGPETWPLDDPDGFLKFPVRRHQANGVIDTQCYVGDL